MCVAEILSVAPHPKADRLRVVQARDRLPPPPGLLLLLPGLLRQAALAAAAAALLLHQPPAPPRSRAPLAVRAARLQVDAGGAATLKVVTNAQNVEEGMKVVFAVSLAGRREACCEGAAPAAARCYCWHNLRLLLRLLGSTRNRPLSVACRCPPACQRPAACRSSQPRAEASLVTLLPPAFRPRSPWAAPRAAA